MFGHKNRVSLQFYEALATRVPFCRISFKIFIVIVTLFFTASCSRRQSQAGGDAAETSLPLQYSELLKVYEGKGYTKVEIENPWDSSQILNTYILVPDTAALPANLPEGNVIRTPIRRALVYSSVHQRALAMLGKRDAIAGICDRDYVGDSLLLEAIKEGRVIDCGNNMSPNMEKIISLRPDVILLSPYENSGNYGRLSRLGIPIVECADYMEAHPLGRAEWLKFFGLLTMKTEVADSMFESTALRYNHLKAQGAAAQSRPQVLVDGIYGQGWTVPSAPSTTAIFINDAGGINPFDYIISAAGTATLAPEQVLLKARDADIWLYRYYQNDDMTMRRLGADSPVYGRFKAYKEGKVYGCNTARVPYYEEVPFEPHLLLEELVALFHPELKREDYRSRYFTKLK